MSGPAPSERDLAYRREVGQYRNCLLVEQPNGDFARTMVRQFLYSAFADLYWRAMMTSSDPALAAINKHRGKFRDNQKDPTEIPEISPRSGWASPRECLRNPPSFPAPSGRNNRFGPPPGPLPIDRGPC